MSHTPALGRSVLRREGIEKLTGEARYLDDLPRAGVWWGGTVRSNEARARIDHVSYDPTFPWDEVVRVTADDIPGENVLPLLIEDQPALVESEIRHAEEAVVLIAAPDKELLDRALRSVRLKTTSLPPVLDIDASLARAQALHGEDNVFKRIDIVRGDVDAALADAPIVIEGSYTFGAQEHVYIEPQGAQAEWGKDGVTIHGSMQCPYYVVGGLARLLDLEPEKIRVIQTTTGGGFGGKEEYPTIIAAHAALLSRKAGRPVRVVYERSEDIRATTKRHPGRVRHRTALEADGRLLGMDIDVVFDSGAYCTLSPVVLSRGAIHAAGPYACGNLRILARAVATNHPPHGAFRGFGAPQTLFALEAHLDSCARRLGLDPVEFRRRNALGPGGILATGQDVGEDVWAKEALETALDDSRFLERRRDFEGFNATAARATGPRRFKRRGIGLALFHHGAGFTGAGEVKLASRVSLRGNPDGTVSVLCSQTEIGQGTRTILAQAAADGLDYPVEWVHTSDPDTAAVPDSGPTVASRTGMVVGGLLLRAGRAFRQRVQHQSDVPLESDEAFREAISRIATQRELLVSVDYEQPGDMQWDDEHYRGDAYASYAWSCQVAAIEVDVLTAEVKVLDITAVQEVGRVMNPVLADGQIAGGVAQGLGWALLENVVYREGRVQNPTLTDYIIPTSMDTPPIHVRFLEHPHPRAPHGAKGIGELPMDGPAPAVINALRAALGIDLCHVPATPERILEAMNQQLD